MFCWLCHEAIQESLCFMNLFRPPDRICRHCRSRLESVQNGCPNCGKKGGKGWCRDCHYWKKQGFIVKNHSLYYYNAFAKTLIERVKYHGDLRLLHAFKSEIRQYYKRVFLKSGFKHFIIVPVPLSYRKHRQRGFNQALVLAQSLPFPIYDVLHKARDFTQSQRSRNERLMAKNDFYLKKPIDVQGKRVLIVDDIYTTGSTVHQIARLLQEHAPQEIRSFTLFRS